MHKAARSPECGQLYSTCTPPHTHVAEAPQHDVFKRGTRYFCRACKDCVRRRVAQAWLATPCLPLNAVNAPAGARRPALAKGKRIAHDTHALRYFGQTAIALCTKCGCVSRARIGDLASPCTGLPTKTGQHNINAVLKGSLPSWAKKPNRPPSAGVW